jgi:hypothetical protein
MGKRGREEGSSLWMFFESNVVTKIVAAAIWVGLA